MGTDEVIQRLSGNRWLDLPRDRVEQFIQGLDWLLAGKPA